MPNDKEIHVKYFEFGDPGEKPEPESKSWVTVAMSQQLLELLAKGGYEDHLQSPETNYLPVGSEAWLNTLPNLEKKLFAFLSQQPNQLVTKEALYQVLWPEDQEPLGLAQRLRGVVNHLNEKINDDHFYLKTVEGQGYILFYFSADSSLWERRFIQALTTNELKIFQLFWKKMGQTVTGESCHQTIWPKKEFKKGSSKDKRLSRLISSLRKKLKNHSAQCEIDLVFDVGYQLVTKSFR